MMKFTWPRRSLMALAVLASLAAQGGCGGDDAAIDANTTDAGPPDASATCVQATMHSDFTWIQENVFNKSCTGMSCHDADKPAAMLNLTAGAAHAQIVGVDSVELPAYKRIKAGSCDESFLYKKITNDTAIIDMGDCSQVVTGGKCRPMPTVSSTFQPLCQEKIDAICRWITAGAPMN